MRQSPFKNMSEEQLSQMSYKALQKRKENRELNEKNSHLYKIEYLDLSFWQSLASKYRVRMPSSIAPCTITGMKKYLKRLDIDVQQLYIHAGISKLQQLIDMNPKLSLLGFVGNILELKEEISNSKK